MTVPYVSSAPGIFATRLVGPTPPSLDRETALGLLGAVVAERPDRIYKAPRRDGLDDQLCIYVDGDVPSCLIGRALALHGWPLERLRELDKAGVSAHGLPEEMADLDARQIFNEAQWAQDRGKSWITALAVASQDATP